MLMRLSITKKLCSNVRLFSHVPVMADEIVQILNPENGKIFIDMTFGGGGHTRKLLDTNKSIKVIAIDRDPVAIAKAHELAAEVAVKSERFNIRQSVIPIHGEFSKVMRDIHLNGIEYGTVNGVIFDLGASSMQYDNPERGFSLSGNGKLDMRMDTSNNSNITAEDVINSLDQSDLATIFRTLGEERRAYKMANAILDARALLGRIRTTHELARIVTSSSSANFDSLGRYAHPGTKIFQALRIFVNNELNELNYALDRVYEFLIPTKLTTTNHQDKEEEENLKEPYGVAAVLTFHSLEDRIVKRHFTGIDPNEPVVKCLSQHDRIRTNMVTNWEKLEELNNVNKWKPITKHVWKPTEAEIAANPRSRSAKLRAALRVETSEIS